MTRVILLQIWIHVAILEALDQQIWVEQKIESIGLWSKIWPSDKKDLICIIYITILVIFISQMILKKKERHIYIF